MALDGKMKAVHSGVWRGKNTHKMFPGNQYHAILLGKFTLNLAKMVKEGWQRQFQHNHLPARFAHLLKYPIQGRL